MLKSKCLLLGSLVLVGCGVNTMPTDPQAIDRVPVREDYVNSRQAQNYHNGMINYRNALLAFRFRLDAYIEELSFREGLVNRNNSLCQLPYQWRPMVLPEPPSSRSKDPAVAIELMMTHIHALRAVIVQKNREYAPCVKSYSSE